MELPARKHPRLKEYDYGQNGAYFVTVCTKDRTRVLSRIGVGRGLAPAEVMLTDLGVIVERQLLALQERYPLLSVEPYVIMPNHVHAVLRFDNERGRSGTAGASPRPTVSDMMCAFKSLSTREAGMKFWQASFHDHIIRDEMDLWMHWKYIEDNPSKWTEDEYYTEQ